MDANVHNCGRLPWCALNDSINIELKPDHLIKDIICDDSSYKYKIKYDKQKIYYFSDKFMNTIIEFSQTLKKIKYNPFEWGGGEYELFHGGQGQTSHFTAMICIYIQLNLLLMDYEKYNKVWDFKHNYFIKLSLGIYDWELPEFLSDKLKIIQKNVLDNNNILTV